MTDAGARAVFLDRDGVINEVVFRDGKPASPRTLDEFVFIDGGAEAVRRLHDEGFLVFVCTNQPDVARGTLDAGTLEQMHARLRATLAVDDVAACPHDNHPPCHCRKPKPGMLLDLAETHHVDLARSYFVGDSHKDMGAGRAAGVVTVLVRRAYNRDTQGEIEVDGLPEAVDRIIERSRGD